LQPKWDFSDLRVGDGSQIEEYGRFQQHAVLVEDTARVGRFVDAIETLPPLGTALDIGGGSGVLSLACLQHGIENVVYVEPSTKMCRYASHMFEENGYSKRVRIINSTLESAIEQLKNIEINYLVGEFVSSVVFGFSCWDAIPTLILTQPNLRRMIPESGEVVGVFLDENSTIFQNGSVRPVAHLNGRILDIAKHAFRSGGNLFDKRPVLDFVKSRTDAAFQVCSFDSRCNPMIKLDGPRKLIEPNDYVGCLLFFNLTLASEDHHIGLSSLDPGVTSWYPYYVPFETPFMAINGDEIAPHLNLLDIDAPYNYALQFSFHESARSNVLYW
jgi:hypothetical protein